MHFSRIMLLLYEYGHFKARKLENANGFASCENLRQSFDELKGIHCYDLTFTYFLCSSPIQV